MYERMLDKLSEPDIDQIKEHLGAKSYECLVMFEEYLQINYTLSRELRFPFGKSYGWGYKYSHRSAHLCYAFFEKDAFTVTVQIGDKQVESVESILPPLSLKTQELWTNRYPCGERGGWIHFRVLNNDELNDIYRIIHARKKPVLTKRDYRTEDDI